MLRIFKKVRPQWQHVKLTTLRGKGGKIRAYNAFFCPKCDYETVVPTNFCPNCGKRLYGTDK